MTKGKTTIRKEQKQKTGGEITELSSSRMKEPHGTIRLVLAKPSTCYPLNFESRPITLS